MTPSPPRKEAFLSIRLVWPFARLLGGDPRAADLLRKTGLQAADFANPDTRLPHRVVMTVLEDTVALLGDPTVGLQAGERVDPGDFDVMENASRGTGTLGEAIRCAARYFRILNEAAEISLVEVGDRAEWRFRVTDGVTQPPAANDFSVASALAFSRRNTVTHESPLEIRLMHAEPSYASQYARFFDCPVRFGASANTIVMRRARLSVPMREPSPEMQRAFELQAKQLLDRLESRRSVSARVREEICAQLQMGSVTMDGSARRLAMSVATLRRRLEEEGTTFSGIVDETRRQLAERYLVEPRPGIGEIAFMLGFSNVTAFGRAFRRWVGTSPTEYRAAAVSRSA